jgi:APA family basic amino acid/polyamine antiporter
MAGTDNAQDEGLLRVIGTGAVALIFLCFAEVGSRITRSGGSYAYIEEALGPFIGFIASVLYWFGWGTLADAAITVIMVGSLAILFPILSCLFVGGLLIQIPLVETQTIGALIGVCIIIYVLKSVLRKRDGK